MHSFDIMESLSECLPTPSNVTEELASSASKSWFFITKPGSHLECSNVKGAKKMSPKMNRKENRYFLINFSSKQ